MTPADSLVELGELHANPDVAVLLWDNHDACTPLSRVINTTNPWSSLFTFGRWGRATLLGVVRVNGIGSGFSLMA